MGDSTWRAFVLVALVSVAIWVLLGFHGLDWRIDKQTKVACLTARADPVVHAYCVKNGFDR